MFDIVYSDTWILYECFNCKKRAWKDELGDWHLSLNLNKNKKPLNEPKSLAYNAEDPPGLSDIFGNYN